MEFFNESNKPTRVAMPKCTKLQPEYEEFIDPKTGEEYLKKVGETNTYEKIQEAKDGTYLKSIIERTNFNIDKANLFKIDETIKDFTNVPNNIIDTLNIIKQAETTFEEMPKELRKKFNNNFNEFLIGAQNGTLETYLNTKKPKDVLENQISMEIGQKTTLEDEIQKAKDKLEELQQKSLEGVNNG